MTLGGVIVRYWWVLIVLLICFAYYYRMIRPKEAEIRSLKYRVQEIKKEKELAEGKKEELQARIQSQNDPAWIEMVLMKELGVVPEGYLKVHFQKKTKE